jgi:hypothetical protein
MKKKFNVVLIFAIAAALILNSCDDSGIQHLTHQKGIISFTQKNMKRMDPGMDGVYELWLLLEVSGVSQWHSLGKFNIGLDGVSMVDLNEQPMTFKFNGDTTFLSNATYSAVSIEDTNVHFTPSSAKFLSAKLGVNQDSIWGNLYIGGELSLDAAGRNLYTVSQGLYNVQTPTTGLGYPECYKGIWFTTITGDTAGLPQSIALTPGKGWIYEGWVADTSIPSNRIYYSVGRFYDPTSADNDGAGPCAGPNPGYNRPGQDWIQQGCTGKKEIVNLTAGFYMVFITIEPEYETPPAANFYNPFPFFIFRQSMVTSLGCKRLDVMFNIPKAFGLFPEAKLYITN